jgi:branched-chain amino acid transport system substrate-binding protein
MQTTPTTRRTLLRAALAGVSSTGFAPALLAQQNAAIVLGHPYPATGRLSELAADMKWGMDAAVAEVNATGGVRGRPIRLASVDDGHDPKRTVAQARQLRTAEGAVALVAPVGSEGLALLMPWAEETRTPIIGARSGAEAQREYHRWTFFNAASSANEVAFMCRHLATMRALRVGVMYAADATGADVWRRTFVSARAEGLQTVRAESFAADGKDAARGAALVLAQNPDAVILAGSGDSAMQVVLALLAAGLPAGRIHALSSLHPGPLHAALGAKADGIVLSQVMPSPDDPKLELSASYRRALQRLPQARASAAGLEAYVSMQIAARALRQADDPTRGEALVDALERLSNVNLGGLRISFDKTQHRGTRFVELAILSGGRLRR